MTHKYTALLNNVQYVQNSKAQTQKINSDKTVELPGIGYDKRLSSRFDDAAITSLVSEVAVIKNITNNISNKLLKKVPTDRTAKAKVGNDSFEHYYKEMDGQSAFEHQYADRPKTRMGKTQGAFRMSKRKKWRRNLPM